MTVMPENLLNVPYGYCHCGCGELTSVVGGKPRKWRKGHRFRRPDLGDAMETRAEVMARIVNHSENVPYGYCHCGCGEKTRISHETDRRRGYVKDVPRFYLPRHNQRKVFGVPACGYVIDPETGCWVWMLMLYPKTGYSHMSHNGVSRLGHIVMYEEKYGPVPEGLQLDHLCRNRRCINPDHLEPVTATENSHRGSSTKLTASEVLTIREEIDQGKSSYEIAAAYGVSARNIRHIMSGATWSSVQLGEAA